MDVSWTVKKAERRRIDAFELWYWRRLLRVPWTAKRSNQPSLKEISPEYSLEGLMLKLKFQYFGYLIGRLTHWKRPWCWERVKVGEGDDRGLDGWMASPIRWAWVWACSRSWWWTGRPGVLQSMGLKSQIWLTAELMTDDGGVVNEICAHNRSCEGITDMNSKHNQLSKDQFQKSIFFTCFKERKKKKKKKTNSNGPRTRWGSELRFYLDASLLQRSWVSARHPRPEQESWGL